MQGSAWFRQDIYIHLPELLRMCQRGYCVALVQYRPSTTAKFPARTEDVVLLTVNEAGSVVCVLKEGKK